MSLPVELLQQPILAPLPPPPESPEPDADVLDAKTMFRKAKDQILSIDELKQYIAAGKDVNYQNEDGETVLMMTASNGRTELIQMLLDANADVNMQADDGWTALHTALFNCHFASTMLLLDAEGNLWLENVRGVTPMCIGLHYEHSNDDMMRFLLEHGTCEDTGFTALMEASRRGYVPAVTKLLALGANVYEKDKYGTTALDVASSEECAMLLRQHTMMSAPLPPPPESPEPDVLDEKTMVQKALRERLTVDELKHYIAARKDVNYQDEFGNTALMGTAGDGQTELTQMLLDGETVLMMTASNGRTELIQMLLDANADVNMQADDGWTALHMALFNCHFASTMLLLDAEGNLWLENVRGVTPMSLGLQRQHSNDDMMRLLLEHGTCKDTGFTALMEASRRGYVPAVTKLLALGANVYEKDKYGTTALDVASCEECAMLLRQHTMMSAPLPPPPESPEPDVLDEKTMVEKALRERLTVDELKHYIAARKDVNYQDEFGNTALMGTAGNGQTELTQMLLDANADVNMQNNFGHTGLHRAAQSDDRVMIAQLIKAGADVNLQADDGNTALHWALSRCDMACVSLLVDAKANLWIERKNRETPMSLGLQRQHSNDDMMRLLLEHGTCKDTGFTALMEAARRDYVPAIEKLLALGANRYEKDKYGTKALYLAYSLQRIAAIRERKQRTFVPRDEPVFMLDASSSEHDISYEYDICYPHAGHSCRKLGCKDISHSAQTYA